MEGAERVSHTKKRATPSTGPQHLIGRYVTTELPLTLLLPVAIKI